MIVAGTLGSANSYGTKRPTAGAFVSLDPGYGPADTDAWISNRSPYVQNVTTCGTKCIGLKIDGDIHDGGNDSIVANDFTQILDEGIGAWVTRYEQPRGSGHLRPPHGQRHQLYENSWSVRMRMPAFRENLICCPPSSSLRRTFDAS